MGKKYYLLNSLPFLQLLRCKALGSILLELFVLIPELVHTINHLLDQLNLRVSEPVLVGDVVGVSGLATRLSTGSTGLQVKLLAASLELVDAVLGPAGQVNVDGGPHASTQVGGARVDVAVLLIQAEVLARLSLDRVLDGLDTLGQSAEHFPDISTLLHRDNTELVLLVDPDKEGLLGVVEDTTSLGPVALHASNSKVSVARDEEEVEILSILYLTPYKSLFSGLYIIIFMFDVGSQFLFGFALLVCAPDQLLQQVPLLIAHLLKLVELSRQLSELSPH